MMNPRALLTMLLLGSTASASAGACARRRADTAIADEARDANVRDTPSRKGSLTVFHGKVVDLDERCATRVLGGGPVAAEVDDGASAFVLGEDAALRAFDLESGALQWEIAVDGRCGRNELSRYALAQDARTIYCTGDGRLFAFDKSSGASRWSTASVVVGSSEGDFNLPIPEIVVGDHRVFVQRLHRPIEVIDAADGRTLAAATFPSAPGWSNLAIFPSESPGFCATAESRPRFLVACFDDAGAQRFSTELSLAKPGDPLESDFALVARTPRHLVFGPRASSKTHRSVVVDLRSGLAVLRVEAAIAAVVETELGDLDSAIVVEPSLALLDPSGRLLWSNPSLALPRLVTPLLVADRLFLAANDPLRAAPRLAAVTRETGTLLFEASVERLKDGFDSYRHLELEQRGGDILLRGLEYAGSSLQIFSVDNGARRYSDLWSAR